MKRLRLIDAILLTILVPLWVVCVFLHVKEIVRGRLARVPLFVASATSASEYPTLQGFWPGTGAEASGLAVGDRLTRVGNLDLRGVGSIEFWARTYEAITPELQVSLSYLRGGSHGETALQLDPVVFPWRTIPMILALAVTGVLVLLRMPRSRPAQAWFLGSITFSIHWALFFGGPRWQTYMWVAVYALSAFVILPLMLRAVLVLPEEVAPTNKWALRWPWVFALLSPFSISWYFGAPLPHDVGMRAFHLLNQAFLIALLVILTRNFLRAGPLGRRQLKWVLYGFYIAAVPALITMIIALLEPSLWWLQEAAFSTSAFAPICFAIAIVRFNLFDIDRLISSTTSYTILLLILGVGSFTLIPQVARGASSWAGLDPASGQVVFSVVLALCALPGQRYLRSYIERLFFVDRYRVEQGMKQLQYELSQKTDAHTLLFLLGDRLEALFRPENCVVYGATEEDYVPLLVRGSVVPPIFAVQSPLVGALHSRSTPVDMERWQRAARTYLSREDRSALESLRVAVVLPIGQKTPPMAFICLGQKRSGDVYTSSDFTALGMVAAQVSQILQRFDEAALRGQLATATHELQAVIGGNETLR